MVKSELEQPPKVAFFNRKGEEVNMNYSTSEELNEVLFDKSGAGQAVYYEDLKQVSPEVGKAIIANANDRIITK